MSQNKLILAHLNEGNSLTALDALREFGCFRLAARISDLKGQGNLILKRSKTVLTRKNGNVVIAEYYIGPSKSVVNGL